MTARKRSALRGALAKRKSRVEHFRIPIEDSDVIDAIAQRLSAAKNLAGYVEMGSDDEAKKRNTENVAAIQAEFDACFHTLDIVGRTTAELNDVNNQFPDEDET